MRLGIGATDSMWPKKRRIRLRVLKAVAIVRPRLGSRAANYPAAVSELTARQSRSSHPLQWATCRSGHRIHVNPRPLGKEARWGRPPKRPAPSVNVLLELDLGALGLELRLELLGIGLRHGFLDRLRCRFD